MSEQVASSNDGEAKRARMDEVDERIDELKKIKQSMEVEDGTPVEIQLVFLSGSGLVTHVTNENIRKEIPAYVEIQKFRHEKLYDVVKGEWSNGIFILVRDEEHAWNVFKRESVMMEVTKGNTVYGVRVEFIRSVQDRETRKQCRMVGNGLVRLKEINERVSAMGAVKPLGVGGIPTFPASFQKKEDAIKQLDRLRELRAEGVQLDAPDYEILCKHKPVDLDALKAELTALYNEKCGLLIRLRTYQASGWEFDFDSESV
jgi:hypothetical protein